MAFDSVFFNAVLFSSCSSSVNKGLNSSLMVENSHLEKGTGYYDIIDMDINIGDDDTIVWNIIPKTIMLLRKIYFLIPTTIPFNIFCGRGYGILQQYKAFSQFFAKTSCGCVRIEEMINYFTYDYPDATAMNRSA